jgi:hypothetical protein
MLLIVVALVLAADAAPAAAAPVDCWRQTNAQLHFYTSANGTFVPASPAEQARHDAIQPLVFSRLFSVERPRVHSIIKWEYWRRAVTALGALFVAGDLSYYETFSGFGLEQPASTAAPGLGADARHVYEGSYLVARRALGLGGPGTEREYWLNLGAPNLAERAAQFANANCLFEAGGAAIQTENWQVLHDASGPARLMMFYRHLELATRDGQRPAITYVDPYDDHLASPTEIATILWDSRDWPQPLVLTFNTLGQGNRPAAWYTEAALAFDARHGGAFNADRRTGARTVLAIRAEIMARFRAEAIQAKADRDADRGALVLPTAIARLTAIHGPLDVAATAWAAGAAAPKPGPVTAAQAQLMTLYDTLDHEAALALAAAPQPVDGQPDDPAYTHAQEDIQRLARLRAADSIDTTNITMTQLPLDAVLRFSPYDIVRVPQIVFLERTNGNIQFVTTTWCVGAGCRATVGTINPAAWVAGFETVALNAAGLTPAENLPVTLIRPTATTMGAVTAPGGVNHFAP